MRLIYDKCYIEKNNHSYNGINCSQTLENFNANDIISGNKAIEFFNKNNGTEHHLPIEILSDMINVEIIKNKNFYITVVDLNIDIMESYFDNKKTSDPIWKFLLKLFRYHIAYSKYEENPNDTYLEFPEYDRYAKHSRNTYSQGPKLYYNNGHNDLTRKNTKEITTTVMKNKSSQITPISTPIDNDTDTKLLTTNLFHYQKCSINWMINKETKTKDNIISFNFNDEIIFNKYTYDNSIGTIILTKDRDCVEFHGGGLIDEVGLGKTIQITTLSLLNPPKNYNLIQNNMFFSGATLIMCPNTLCGQWKREITNKISSKRNPKILTFTTKRDFDKYTYEDLINADFVIVSFTFFNNKNYTDKWLYKVSDKSRLSSVKYPHIVFWEKILNLESDSLLKNPLINIFNKQPLLHLIYWHRIVIDEFHEIHSTNTYSYVATILPFLKSKYRWCVSGTPFIDTNSIYNIYNFLTNYKTIDKYGFNILSRTEIKNYMANYCFRRNTKASVKEEYKLPPIEEEVIMLNFTSTERMMYNAYTANNNNNPSDIYLRKLCCHPQLADETKMALSNCKSLQDIEKMMVTHFKNDAIKSKLKILNLIEKIKENVIRINTCIESYKKNKCISYLLTKGYKKIKEDNDSDNDNDDNIKCKKFKESDINLESEIITEGDDFNIDSLRSYKNTIKTIGNFIKTNIKNTDINNLGKETKKFKNINSVTYNQLMDSLQNKYITLNTLQKEFNGKLSSYTFFSNVINKLRNVDKKKEKKKMNIKEELKDLDLSDMSDMSDLSGLSDMSDLSDDENEDENVDVCGICFDAIKNDDCGVTSCGHIFCYSCLKSWISKKSSCPYCKKGLAKSQVYVLSYEKKPTKEATPEEKSKASLINKVGTKLANLIFYLKKNDKHTILFSQWDDLLKRVGKILNENGVKNIFCRGNLFQRDKAIREFEEGVGIKVIMLSSESAASGTNLTKAKQIIMLDPVYGEYKYRKDTENQAIGRAHRLGQTDKLKVVRFIIKDTIEDVIYNQNVKEDKKYMKEHNSVPDEYKRNITKTEVK